MTVSGTRSISDIGIGAAWLVGIAAVARIIDVVIATNPLTAAIFGAVVVDLAAHRAGVRWESPTKEGQTSADIARSIATGLAFALTAAAIVVAVGAATGWAEIALGSPSVGSLMALLRSTGLAVRDELLLRGLVLVVALRAGVSLKVATAYAALSGGAAIALVPGATPEAVALACTSGWLFAELWRRAGGAFAAVSAHALWSVLLTSGLRGGLLDVFWGEASLSDTAKADGRPVWLAAIVCAGLAVAAPRVLARWGAASSRVPPPPPP